MVLIKRWKTVQWRRTQPIPHAARRRAGPATPVQIPPAAASRPAVLCAASRPFVSDGKNGPNKQTGRRAAQLSDITARVGRQATPARTPRNTPHMAAGGFYYGGGKSTTAGG